MLILTENISPRLEYILDLLFKELLGLSYTISSDIDVFKDYHGAKINYSSLELGGLTIKPSTLLFEKDLHEISTSYQKEGNEVLLMDEDYFDPLAASFFFVSRYEEHLKSSLDNHNRYSASSSHLHKLGILNTPIVNIWALDLLTKIQSTYPDITALPRKFDFLSTIDIDQAWKYKYKGFLRTQGAIIRDILDVDKNQLAERRQVLKGQIADPFDNFEMHQKWHDEFNTAVQYFIQVGRRGKFDKNQSAKHPPFQKLIRRLDQYQEVSIHPSYQSNESIVIVKDEINTLEKILNRTVTKSRQHFLMHRMPQTYHNLIELGMKEDYTLGYSTHLGFRAGIAAPFYFYDFIKEKKTDLRIIPFCVMDITPMHYMNLNLDQAIETVLTQIDAVKQVGGMYCSLWHNESLSDSGRWKGWRPLYKEILSACSQSS